MYRHARRTSWLNLDWQESVELAESFRQAESFHQHGSGLSGGVEDPKMQQILREGGGGAAEAAERGEPGAIPEGDQVSSDAEISALRHIIAAQPA